MAPVYADHPFNLIETPISKLPKDAKVYYFAVSSAPRVASC